ncbi:hypothetical protein [Chryseobacterium sp. T16E-39]|nr:hypothetical protein [Chryseobacterium sp. T16E-39]
MYHNKKMTPHDNEYFLKSHPVCIDNYPQLKNHRTGKTSSFITGLMIL